MSRLDPSRGPDLKHQHRALPKPPRELALDESDRAALKAVGSFRVVQAVDLPGVNVDRLVRKGVLLRREFRPVSGGKPYEVLTLSERGLDLLRRQPSHQRYWAGVKKVRELEHDLMIYPAYLKEAEAIRAAGGTIKRVRLDYELKSEINPRVNKPGADRAALRDQIAAEYKLPIIKHRVALPDARIEYIDASGHEQHKDIEIVTKQYKGSHMAGRKQSGFKIYRAAKGGPSVRDDHRMSLI